MRKTQATGTDQLMHTSNLLESYCIVTVLWEDQRTRLGIWKQIHTYGAPGTNTLKNISTPATTVPFARYNNGSIAIGYQTLPSLLPWTILYTNLWRQEHRRRYFLSCIQTQAVEFSKHQKEVQGLECQTFTHLKTANGQHTSSALPQPREFGCYG